MSLDCDPQEAADMLRALAHPTRLAVLCRLLDGDAAVSEFEEQLGLRQPNLSQQLAYLRDAGLVATRRISKSVIYHLTDERVRPLIGALRATFAAPGTQAPAVSRPARPAPTDRPVTPVVSLGLDPGTATHTGTGINSRIRPSDAEATRAEPHPAQRKIATPACGVFSTAGWPRN
jgi:DNA-binding transcriptional ArsR family regulator